MMWILIVLVLLAAAGGFALLAARRSTSPAAGPRRRCVRCRGTGWIGGEPERTLNVEGDGFENRHVPATMCPACGGTGTIS
ncbi:MAG: hypothetical protein ABW046_23215 [Actinoplanes sp.]